MQVLLDQTLVRNAVGIQFKTILNVMSGIKVNCIPHCYDLKTWHLACLQTIEHVNFSFYNIVILMWIEIIST